MENDNEIKCEALDSFAIRLTIDMPECKTVHVLWQEEAERLLESLKKALKKQSKMP